LVPFTKAQNINYKEQTMRLFAAILAVAMLPTCKTTPKSNLQEGMDALNDPGIFQAHKFPYETLKKSDYLSGKLDAQPWSDTYWPLLEAELAARWIDTSVAFDLEADVTKANFSSTIDKKISAAMANAKSGFGKSAKDTSYVSPAEKIDLALDRKDMPFVAHELSQFKKNSLAYADIDWGWMGNCHGWAPAAFMENAPKSGVMLTSVSGQDVFFSPGDIRAVLTKAAADNGYSGQDRFLGARCDDPAAEIPRDKMGRIIDASLGVYNSGSFLSDSMPIRIDHNGWDGFTEVNDQSPAVIGRIGPKFNDQPQIWISAEDIEDATKDVRKVRIYSTKKSWFGRILRDQIIVGRTLGEIGVFVDSNGQPIMENGQPKRDESKARTLWRQMTDHAPDAIKNAPMKGFSFKYWKACRDANPGAFHLTMVSLMSKGANTDKPTHGFVMDVTRDDQVWNHPVSRYESVMGEPTKLKIDASEDPFTDWRAPGTQSIVDVITTVEYAVENGPQLTYTKADEATHTIHLRYTLELDKNGMVIGGEWHPNTSSSAKPKSGKDLLESLAKIATNFAPKKLVHPDFIWGPKPSASINDGFFIPKALVTKLQECSAKDPGGRTFKIMEQLIPVVHCRMQ
jgi:hypothetical protein